MFVQVCGWELLLGVGVGGLQDRKWDFKAIQHMPVRSIFSSFLFFQSCSCVWFACFCYYDFYFYFYANDARSWRQYSPPVELPPKSDRCLFVVLTESVKGNLVDWCFIFRECKKKRETLCTHVLYMFTNGINTVNICVEFNVNWIWYFDYLLNL